MTEKIDLNTADPQALDGIEGLRGHGPEIVRYREERGGFASLHDLEEVPGLTGKVPDDIADYLRI